MAKVKDLLQVSIQKNIALAAAIKEKEAEAEAAAAAAKAAAEAAAAGVNGAGGNGAGGNGSGSSGSLAQQKQSGRSSFVTLDSKKLLQNLHLQQSLLKENKDLMKTFQETVMQGGLPYEEFWSTRVHILRAHALSTLQQRGPYNVLSTIKPTTNSDNKVSVSVSREKIHDIFDQYPLVRQAYNDLVPKVAEGEFWSRFFLSRLFRSLRGEKQKPSDPTDLLLDKYLDMIDNSSLTGVKRKAGEMTGPGGGGGAEDGGDELDYSVPFFLDIAGNEESDPQKLGNRPDMTMRSGTEGPSALSLIRSMNNLSQKMMYGTSAHPGGATIVSMQDKDESNLGKELKLAGLDKEIVPGYVELHLKSGTLDMQSPPQEGQSLSSSTIHTASTSSTFFATPSSGGPSSGGPSSGGSSSSGGPPVPPPTHAQIMVYLNSNLDTSLDLQQAGLKFPDGISKAQKQITKTIKLRAREASDNRTQEEREVEKDVFDHVHLCHATSVEFLRHFWIHFQSGDVAQAPAITKLVASLKKSLQRIDAVEKSAVENKELVKSALQPLIDSIRKALYAYNKALQEVLSANNRATPPVLA